MRILLVIFCVGILIFQTGCCCRMFSTSDASTSPKKMGYLDYAMEMKRHSEELQTLNQKMMNPQTDEDLEVLEEEYAAKLEKLQELQEEFIESDTFKNLEKSDIPAFKQMVNTMKMAKEQQEHMQEFYEVQEKMLNKLEKPYIEADEFSVQDEIEYSDEFFDQAGSDI